MRVALVAIALAGLLPASVATQQTAETGRSLLVFIDDLHLDFRMTPRTRDLLKRLLPGVIREEDRISIVSTGHSSISERPTLDRSIIDSVINRVTGGGLRPEELLAASQSPQGNTEFPPRVRVSIATMYEALRALSQFPGQRLMIYIGNGFTLPTGRTDRAYSSVTDLTKEFQELIRVANAAAAPIHVVWPRGLIDQSLLTQPDSDEWRRYLLESQNTLRVLAAQTGGLAVFDTSGYENAVIAIR